MAIAEKTTKPTKIFHMIFSRNAIRLNYKKRRTNPALSLREAYRQLLTGCLQGFVSVIRMKAVLKPPAIDATRTARCRHACSNPLR